MASFYHSKAIRKAEKEKAKRNRRKLENHEPKDKVQKEERVRENVVLDKDQQEKLEKKREESREMQRKKFGYGLPESEKTYAQRVCAQQNEANAKHYLKKYGLGLPEDQKTKQQKAAHLKKLQKNLEYCKKRFGYG